MSTRHMKDIKTPVDVLIPRRQLVLCHQLSGRTDEDGSTEDVELEARDRSRITTTLVMANNPRPLATERSLDLIST